MCVEVELYEAFDYSDSIVVYEEGVQASYEKDTVRYGEILTGFKELIKDAHEMPAYGVSLNRETLKELKNGLWVEFCFSETYECNGMPFEKLLVKAEKSFFGFNIIRYNSKNGYDGRCFYYDLVNKNMSNFYNILR